MSLIVPPLKYFFLSLFHSVIDTCLTGIIIDKLSMRSHIIHPVDIAPSVYRMSG